jgi:hypothetical protein
VGLGNLLVNTVIASDAKQSMQPHCGGELDCFASLAMTEPIFRD